MSQPSRNRAAQRPLNIGEIAEEAEKIVWNPQIPLKYWVGALEALYREGRNYLHEGNYAKAYLLLLRYSSLYINHVSGHPDAKSKEGRRLLKPTKDRTPIVFDQLEEIKPYITDAFSEWERMTDASSKVQGASPREQTQYERYASRDAALSWNSRVQAKLIDATENQDLAVDLATQELRRRETARKATRRAGISEEEEHHRRGAGLWDNWEKNAVASSAADDDLRRHMEATRRRLEHTEEDLVEENASQHRPISSASYHYPSITKSTPLPYDASEAKARRDGPLPRPPRPPKESFSRPFSVRPESPPPRPPQKELLQDHRSPPISNQVPPPLPPKNMEVTPKKERYTFRPAGYLENGDPVRPIFLPENLRKDFIRLATENTRRGVEMCGLLCGTSVNNALFITRLLVPEQRCTPDTCETTNEAATFDFMDREDLIQLGWIHTHPTQTCFMSSRDLHTQAGYQIMMPESIAIVCAPRHEPSWGIFRLTNPPGLSHLLKCEKTDTFHQHSLPSDDLYTDAGHPPGHVYVTSKMGYEVHDLRTEK